MQSRELIGAELNVDKVAGPESQPTEPSKSLPPALATTSKLRKRISDAAWPIGTLVVLLLVWWAWVTLGDVPSYLIPAPQAAAAEMFGNWQNYVEDTWVTTQEMLLGFAVAVALGLPLAIGISAWPFFEKSVYPLLVTSQVVPKIAFGPLFVIWFGFGITSKVMIAALIAFFPIVINTVAGLQSLEQEKIYLARSMGATSISSFVRIRFPHALPSIFAGLKLASVLAVIGAVVGEFIGADAGLGRTILLANARLDTERLFAAVGYLTLVGVAFFLIFELLERIAIPWHVSKRNR